MTKSTDSGFACYPQISDLGKNIMDFFFSKVSGTSLVPKESMVSDSVGTRPWYLAAPRKDQAISQPVPKHGFRRAVFVKRLFGDA